MIKAREWPMRAIYILIAAALALSLFITAAPSHNVSAAPNNNVKAEWERVTTPTTEDWVLAPESTIIDATVADGGDVAYAIVDSYWGRDGDYFLLKSEDGAATWDDINDALEDVLDDNEAITRLIKVATDWEDPDFVAVALSLNISNYVYVFFSIDGGDTFIDADEVEDGGVSLNYSAGAVADLAVSLEAGGKRDIAIGGIATDGRSGLFRSTVTGDNAGGWEDATAYLGWDDAGEPSAFISTLVTDIIFSPNWATDKTILVTTTNATAVWLQCGSMGTTEGWNKKSTLGINAVPIIANVTIPTALISFDGRAIAGMTLPSDYNSKSIDTRVLWVWVNYYGAGNIPACEISRVDNDSADPVGPLGQIEDGEVWLTNISYQGTIAEGEAIAGVLGDGSFPYNGNPADLLTGYCVGVQVYRNSGIHNMDICCERWKKACKPPTGRAAMGVAYVGEDKAYAVALQGVMDYDEGAWSVTFDDGNTWNQLSLIDTDIHYLSDVAVSPDCNKMMLVSVNTNRGGGCDSVWLKATNLPEAEEYSGKWLRTWCGQFTGYWSEQDDEAGFLRLPLTEDTGETVYLVDFGTENVYRNDLETLGCWESLPATELDEIVDLVATDADTLWALDYNGDVAMFAEDEWQEAVDSEITNNGWSIAVHGDYILVGARFDEVSYSEDGGETFTLIEPDPVDTGHITVAFDTYFDTNKVIYAAVEGWGYDGCYYSQGGIYRWVIGESTDWEDMGANNNYAYTGIVLDRPSPANPQTSPETGGVLYASYIYYDDCGYYWQEATGVARSLNPAETIECLSCVEWDYLDETNPEGWFWGEGYYGGDYSVGFEATPDALKICGCLVATSNSKLYAIDTGFHGIQEGHDYDMDKAEWGTVWTFEDCYAKKAPEIILPTGNVTIPADPCSCYNAPFTVKWDGLCDACKYELEFALDENFDSTLEPIEVPPEGSKSITSYFVRGGEPPTGQGLSCETTYYVRVRARQAGTDQVIRSWWSEPLKITIAPSVQAAEITLVSPAPGATGVAIKNLGFSWDLLADADAFDWVLSTNADLTAPVESKTGLTTNAYTCTKTLTYGTAYYWMVTAYNEGVAISTSAIGAFTTAVQGAFCCPIDGLCFDTRDALLAHNTDAHPAQPATPLWVWVVIAIGAVLVIVVIVLIFRTRRV